MTKKQEIIKMGHPTLRKVARELSDSEIQSKEIDELVKSMIKSMRDVGGIGLAAPQVNVSLKLAIIEIDEQDRYDTDIDYGLQVFYNPEITPLTDETQAFWEGCLSVPGLRGLVSRPNKIKVTYKTRDLEVREIIAEGFLATVFQHEFDHLIGKLYIDRISDLQNLGYEDELQKLED